MAKAAVKDAVAVIYTYIHTPNRTNKKRPCAPIDLAGFRFKKLSGLQEAKGSQPTHL